MIYNMEIHDFLQDLFYKMESLSHCGIELTIEAETKDEALEEIFNKIKPSVIEHLKEKE